MTLRERKIVVAYGWVTLALLVAMTLVVSGCSVQYGELSVIPGLAPSDEVQTATISRIGVNVDAKQMAVNVGYERVQQTRVPGYDGGTYVPSVRAETRVDAETGAGVGETLEVGRYEGERGEAPASGGFLRGLIGGN